MAKSGAKSSRARLPAQLHFLPHPSGDPIGPVDLGPEIARELTALRLQHQRAVNDLQSKALDQALAILKKPR